MLPPGSRTPCLIGLRYGFCKLPFSKVEKECATKYLGYIKSWQAYFWLTTSLKGELGGTLKNVFNFIKLEFRALQAL